MNITRTLLVGAASAALAVGVIAAPSVHAQGGTTTLGGSSNPACLATAAGIGSTAFLLAPLAGSSHVSIPGVDDVVGGIRSQVIRTNNDLQHGLGIHNPHSSAVAADVDAQLAAFAESSRPVVGGAAALGGGILASSLLSEACLPE